MIPEWVIWTQVKHNDVYNRNETLWPKWDQQGYEKNNVYNRTNYNSNGIQTAQRNGMKCINDMMFMDVPK
jgi:hypothetical protein